MMLAALLAPVVSPDAVEAAGDVERGRLDTAGASLPRVYLPGGPGTPGNTPAGMRATDQGETHGPPNDALHPAGELEHQAGPLLGERISGRSDGGIVPCHWPGLAVALWTGGRHSGRHTRGRPAASTAAASATAGLA